jgi:hypothetical protein
VSSPIWGSWPVFIILWQLRSCFYGAPSLTRGRVCLLYMLLCNSLSRVRVPWDSWPYFTVSDLRLPFSSPPTARRVTLEVFFPASIRFLSARQVKVKAKVTLRLTVSQSVSLGLKPHLQLMTRYLLLFDNYGLVFVGALSNERTRLPFVYAAGPRQRSFSWVRVPWDSSNVWK